MQHTIGLWFRGILIFSVVGAITTTASAGDYQTLPGLTAQDRTVLAATLIGQGHCKNGLMEVREAIKTLPDNETLVRLKGLCEAQMKNPEAKNTIMQWLGIAPPNHPERSKMLTLLATSQVATDTSLDWILIPSGEFSMGTDGEEGQADERPKHKVFLDAFYIAKYETSNIQYHTFLEATDHRLPENCCDSKYNLWLEHKVPDDVGNLPVVNISWDDAAVFCKWNGGRLPSEAEWEKAARGTDERLYPWGNEPVSRERANYSSASVRFWDGLGTLDKVTQGSFGRSPYGVYQMAGNLWEWTQDWYEEAYYAKSAPKNPLSSSAGTMRVIRGGSWRNTSDALRASNRNKHIPDSRVLYIGIRCAKDAK